MANRKISLIEEPHHATEALLLRQSKMKLTCYKMAEGDDAKAGTIYRQMRNTHMQLDTFLKLVHSLNGTVRVEWGKI